MVATERVLADVRAVAAALELKVNAGGLAPETIGDSAHRAAADGGRMHLGDVVARHHPAGPIGSGGYACRRLVRGSLDGRRPAHIASLSCSKVPSASSSRPPTASPERFPNQASMAASRGAKAMVARI